MGPGCSDSLVIQRRSRGPVEKRSEGRSGDGSNISLLEPSPGIFRSRGALGGPLKPARFQKTAPGGPNAPFANAGNFGRGEGRKSEMLGGPAQTQHSGGAVQKVEYLFGGVGSPPDVHRR